MLIRLLENKDVQTVMSAEMTLAHFRDESQSAIPALLKLHARREEAYYEIGYDALANMGARGREAMLADARLPGGKYEDAMRALSNAHPYEDGIATLIDGLRHPDANIRYAAAQSFHGAAAAPAVPELIRRLDDPDFEVQRAAAMALGAIGRGAAPAIPALRAAAARDPGKSPVDLHWAAASAIREIEWYLKR
jgi:HEAT repeat protein